VILLLLKRYWHIAAIVLLVAAGFGAYKWQAHQAEKFENLSIHLSAQLDEARAAIRRAGEQARVARETSIEYQAELERLRNAPPVTRTVRLCPDPSPGSPGVPGTPAGADGPGSPGGELPGGAGPDIGPWLYYEAGRADAVAAQLRALQAWINRQLELNDNVR